jgi:hypothetical protein
MTEPTELQKSLVDEALFLRGRIVASYSQVELLLADTSVKLDPRFPYPIKERRMAWINIGDVVAQKPPNQKEVQQVLDYL